MREVLVSYYNPIFGKTCCDIVELNGIGNLIEFLLDGDCINITIEQAEMK